MLETREYHTGYPEGNKIVTGYESVGGIVSLKIGGFIGPAESREGPEGRGEPGIQNVLLLSYCAAALGAYRNIGLGYLHVTALIAIEGGNPVSPPKLTGDTPV